MARDKFTVTAGGGRKAFVTVDLFSKGASEADACRSLSAALPNCLLVNTGLPAFFFHRLPSRLMLDMSLRPNPYA